MEALDAKSSRTGVSSESVEYGNYVQYVRDYPDVLDRLLSLWNSFDLDGLKSFLHALDLSVPYITPPLSHNRYAENRDLIVEIVRREGNYRTETGPYMRGADVRKIFTYSADDYDALWDNVWSYENRAMVIQELDPSPGERVLEVGIGTGNNLKHFPPHCEITGVDFSSAMLAVCHRKAEQLSLRNVELAEMDVHDLRFDDACFDKILCFYTLCCVEDPGRVLREISRVCIPGGTLVVYDVVRSDIPEVQLLQYLFRPIARELGAVYLEFCPPFNITYDPWVDLKEIVQDKGFVTKREIYFDPFRTAILGVYEKVGR